MVVLLVSTLGELKFPVYFPLGCPPKDAVAKELDVYRLCKSDKITPEDFLSFYQTAPRKYAKLINAYGLSVYPSIEDCYSAMRKAPHLRKKYSAVAHGITYTFTGKVLDTPSKNNPNHITWWLYEGVQPHTYFVPCASGGEE